MSNKTVQPKLMPGQTNLPQLRFHSLTPGRWADFEKLFGPRGACGGCWCMFWRIRRSQFNEQKGAKNRAAIKRIVNAEKVPGILAYAGSEPVGWCSVGPRETYPVLDRSRVMKRLDDRPVWSVVCLFVAKAFRGKGVSVALLKAAAEFARKRGSKIVEGYPTEPRQGKMPDPFVYTGLASAFRKAGFQECARRSETRPLMRRVVADGIARMRNGFSWPACADSAVSDNPQYPPR